MINIKCFFFVFFSEVFLTDRYTKRNKQRDNSNNFLKNDKRKDKLHFFLFLQSNTT